MTKLALSTRFGFAAIVLAALPSVAGAVRPKVPVPTPSGREAAMLKKYDLNHNGKLGPVEQMTARRYRVEKLISILDSNHDRLLSKRELLATPYVGVPLRPRHPWWSWWTASG